MAFTFKLELEDGGPADPSVLQTAMPNWSAGDTIPLGSETLLLVDVRSEDPGQNPVLLVRADLAPTRNVGFPAMRAGVAGGKVDATLASDEREETMNDQNSLLFRTLVSLCTWLLGLPRNDERRWLRQGGAGRWRV